MNKDSPNVKVAVGAKVSIEVNDYLLDYEIRQDDLISLFDYYQNSGSHTNVSEVSIAIFGINGNPTIHFTFNDYTPELLDTFLGSLKARCEAIATLKR